MFDAHAQKNILIVMLQIFDDILDSSPVDQTPLAMHGYYGDSATCQGIKDTGSVLAE